MKVGDIVQIQETGDSEHDLMYRGFFGVITQDRDGKFYVDSDAYCRRTGRLQAVSFRQWFEPKTLAVVPVE